MRSTLTIFQDTNKAQYALIGHLAADSRNVFVVGDEDQSIYSWRGADFRNVLRFRADFPDLKVFLLEQNYRSTKTILEAAQAVISRNAQRTEKTLWTSNTDSVPVHLLEAERVVVEIQRLVARGACRYGDCAVMFRTNAQSRALEDAFMRHAMTYKLLGATRFYQRREIKDVLSYLRLIHNPDDEIGLLRIINRRRLLNCGLGLPTWAYPWEGRCDISFIWLASGEAVSARHRAVSARSQMSVHRPRASRKPPFRHVLSSCCLPLERCSLSSPRPRLHLLYQSCCRLSWMRRTIWGFCGMALKRGRNAQATCASFSQ